MTSPAALLRLYGLHADKKLGQNFLSDQAILEKIVSVAGVAADDTVLEIGPGLGSLTCLLAEKAKEVIAVELDSHLAPVLRDVLQPYSNVRVVFGDILAIPPASLMLGLNYLVVANIPYYITSALIRQLLEADSQPSKIVLTVQREVAERICAGPGDMSLLALSVQIYGQPEVVQHIPAGAFYPPPKVDSAVVRITINREQHLSRPFLNDLFRLAKAGFSQKRKNLRNSLSGGLAIGTTSAQTLLESAGIDPQRRAETLNIEEWELLVDAYNRFPG